MLRQVFQRVANTLNQEISRVVKHNSTLKAETSGLRVSLSLIGSGVTLVCAPAFLAKKHTNHKDAKEAKSIPSLGKAVIYTWEPKEGCIGHQSMLLQSLTGEKLYFSFWPDDEKGKVNLLPYKFMGLGGRFVNDIQADIKEEENHYPQRIAVIYNLDFDHMKTRYNQMHQFIQHKEMHYVLFQSTPSIIRHLNRANQAFPTVSPLRMDPFSELPLDHQPNLPATIPVRHNCTSVIQDILVAGGYPKKVKTLPWGSTPLGQHLELTFIGGREIRESKKKLALINDATNDVTVTAESTKLKNN